MTAFNKIVVPIDFSDQAEGAVDRALAIVADPSHLFLLFVIEPVIDVEANLLWANVDVNARRENTERAMRERFAATRYQGIHCATASGDPGHEIVKYAEAIEADLIVIPSHGRTGISRLLIGSVAERLVRLAHCPVLVLKQPAKKPQRKRRPELVL